jgi:hypothetical protein
LERGRSPIPPRSESGKLLPTPAPKVCRAKGRRRCWLPRWKHLPRSRPPSVARAELQRSAEEFVDASLVWIVSPGRSALILPKMGVAIIPGSTMATRIPKLFTSCAKHSLSASKANFVRHSARSSLAGACSWILPAIPCKLHGHRHRRDDHLLACWTSPPGRPNPQGVRSTSYFHALLAILSFHLTITLLHSITQQTLERNIRQTLSNELVKINGARLVTVTLTQRQRRPIAWVVVRAPQPITPEQVAHLNDLVNQATGSTIDLHVRSVLTAETTSEGYVYDPRLTPTDSTFP